MKYYLGPLLWMGIIFLMSTDSGSSNQTNALFAPIIRFFAPDISRRNLVVTLISIRKIGHVVEYAILSFLWFNAFNQGRKEWRWRPILAAIAVSIFYAALDEFHQAFVRSRTASIKDVGFDSIGAALGPTMAQLRRISSLKAKFFGWWFAWGVFSSILVLIVLRGGPFSFWKALLLIGAVGILSGTAGVLYHVRRG